MNQTPSHETHRTGNPRGVGVSFEFFPPKNEEMEQKLWSSFHRLEPLNPDFVSVTYGAGGSTRERTHNTVSRMVRETSIAPAAHLTCVDATREEVNEVIRAYQASGVKHIVALRGDPAGGIGAKYEPHPDGYANGAELVKGIRDIDDFEVSVSAYPEKHPESQNFAADMDMLRAKVDAGATRAITQFFFVNDYYFRYLDRVEAAGIDIPVTAGILPVLNFKQVSNFADQSGTHIPPWLADRFDGLDDDPQVRRLIAASVVVEQVMDLMQQGVRNFHFYTMNHANIIFAICHLMGIRPTRPLQTNLAREQQDA